jgi:hypothetical protein
MNRLTIARIGLVFAPAAMLIGHLGNHDLIWTQDPISTFAARAPLDVFITVSMVVSSLTLVAVCMAAVAHRPRRPVLGWMIPLAGGASAAGLLLLAAFEETIPPTLSHPPPTPHEIRIQAFHNTGLLVFFFSAVVVLCSLGILWIISRRGRARYGGLIPIVAALGALTAPGWPVFPRDCLGLSQRVSLFLLWFGLAIVAFCDLRNVRDRMSTETERDAAAGAQKKSRELPIF